MGGYPEISYFLSDYFLKYIDNSTIYQTMTFSIPQYKRWFNVSPTGRGVTNWDTLLHAGNLNYSFIIGMKYEETQDLDDLQPIKDRFGCDSLEQARVLWKYILYMSQEFTYHKSTGGKKGHLGIGTFAPQTFYNTTLALGDFLYDFVFGNAAFVFLTDNNITCPQLFINSANSKLNETLSFSELR
jgi:hypothetical protein